MEWIQPGVVELQHPQYSGARLECPEEASGQMILLLHIFGPRWSHRSYIGANWSQSCGFTTFTTQLDKSMAHRHLKSPRSICGRSLHLVTKWSQSWSWMTYSQALCLMSIGPLILRYSYFKIFHENPWSTPCIWSKVMVTFGLEYSKIKVIAMVKPIGHIWGLEFIRDVCFLFRGDVIFCGWDIAKSIFDLENSRSSSWPKSNLMVTFEAKSSTDMFAICFMVIGPFWAEI